MVVVAMVVVMLVVLLVNLDVELSQILSFCRPSPVVPRTSLEQCKMT